jgi:DTW domain-containing protein
MVQKRAGIYNRCPGCRINNNLCACSELKPFAVETNISLVVHVRELKLTSNTAQFVKKMLPHQAEIFIRGRVFENFDSAPITQRPGLPLFLYPHEDSEELNDEFLKKINGPVHLIVPDGNWHQARRVRRREEAFSKLQAVKLPKGIISEYRLRRAPQPEWVSTYEAVAHALGIIEGSEVTDQLMSFFRHWVKKTIHNRTGIEES